MRYTIDLEIEYEVAMDSEELHDLISESIDGVIDLKVQILHDLRSSSEGYEQIRRRLT